MTYFLASNLLTFKGSRKLCLRHPVFKARLANNTNHIVRVRTTAVEDVGERAIDDEGVGGARTVQSRRPIVAGPAHSIVYSTVTTIGVD